MVLKRISVVRFAGLRSGVAFEPRAYARATNMPPAIAGSLTLSFIVTALAAPRLCSESSLCLTSSHGVTADIQHIHLRFQKAINRIPRRADDWLVLVE